jgi:hypothetical protein
VRTLSLGRPRKQPLGAGQAKPKTIGFRVSGEYGAWLDQLAERYRTTVAGLLDRAVAEWAESQGYDQPPPKRMP